MTEQQHPITPPLKLMQQWADKQDFPTFEDIATQAARWGADQELEACCGLIGSAYVRDQVRAARRPKPPSLAEEALNDLDVLLDIAKREGVFSPPGTIRLALERLQELEQQENNDN